jgi:hypothetical protein
VLTSGHIVGILGEDDDGEDLGMLEKKLLEKHRQSEQASQAVSQPTSPSQATSGQDGTSTPRSSITSPEPNKAKDHDHDKRRSVPPAPAEEKKPEEEEVEALSEMMCSLVTNNSGETRYIGTAPSNLDHDALTAHAKYSYRLLIRVFHLLAQGHPVGQ